MPYNANIRRAIDVYVNGAKQWPPCGRHLSVNLGGYRFSRSSGKNPAVIKMIKNHQCTLINHDNLLRY